MSQKKGSKGSLNSSGGSAANLTKTSSQSGLRRKSASTHKSSDRLVRHKSKTESQGSLVTGLRGSVGSSSARSLGSSGAPPPGSNGDGVVGVASDAERVGERSNEGMDGESHKLVKTVPEEEVVVDEEAEYRRKKESLPLEFDMLRRGLSQLGRTPDGLRQVFLKLSIPNAGLSDISMLRDYVYIQNLELPGNNLTDLSVLGRMRYLVQLDASNNKLTEALAFHPPPYNLQEVDLAKNQISVIPDLSAHRFLQRLCLDRNLIRSITGLSECRCLTHLSLVNNGISRIENLDELPIKFLDLRWNRIRSLEGLETLQCLEDLRLAHNSIRSLAGLEDHLTLQRIDLEANQLDDPDEIGLLERLPMLRDLFLRRNPLSADPLYRLMTIFKLPRLTVLDSLAVSPEEKVAAVNMYDPPPNVVASVQHAAMQKRQVRLYASIRAVDLMRAKKLRPIVLCGPSGVGKRTLTTRLLKDFPQIFGVSVSHTTRKPRQGEENGVHYHFVSRAEMDEMIEEGKFVEVVSLFGNMYGTSLEAIDKVTAEGKICVMDLEIEGMLALKRSHLKCRYLFITVPNISILQHRLENRLGSPHSHSSSPLPRTPVSPHLRSSTPYLFNDSNLPPLPQHYQSQPALDELTHPALHKPTRPQTTVPSDSDEESEAMENPSKLRLDPTNEIHRWLAKASLIKEYVHKEDFFDGTIVNDDLEKAYEELKEFCLEWYWKTYDEED